MQDLLKENRTYPALIEALRANADYVKEHLGTIASWLKSEEFQAKYKNKNHPHPPLLSPEDADYKNLSCELAFELNLPLPRNYDFILLFNSSSASESMYIFLKFLKIGINDIKHINNAFKYWQDLYALCTDASHPKVLFVSTKTQGDFEKILYLIDKPVPVIFVARDFISILKSSLNHHDEDTAVPYRIKNLKLYSPFFLPEPSPIFHNLEDLEELSKEHNRQFLFQIAKRIALLNPQRVIALDFTRLAQKDNSEFFDAFNLSPSSHPLFSSQINAYKLLFALPVSLVGGGVELKLMHIKDFVFCKDYIDASKIFLDENLIPSLIIAIKSEDLELCDKALLKEFKSYLKNYTRALALRIKSLKSFTEEDLIAFLLENPSLKSKFIKAWSEDGAYLSKNFPQLFSRFCYTRQLQASKSSSKHRTT